MSTEPVTDPAVRTAIHAGHVGQVVIFCDECGVESAGDYTGQTREVRFAAARRHLAQSAGWSCTDDDDLCPQCAADGGGAAMSRLVADLILGKARILGKPVRVEWPEG